MSDAWKEIIEGQSRLMERYEQALKAIYDDPTVSTKAWALYGLTGGTPPFPFPSRPSPPNNPDNEGERE